MDTVHTKQNTIVFEFSQQLTIVSVMRFLLNSAAMCFLGLLTFGVISTSSATSPTPAVSPSELAQALKFYRNIQELSVDFKMSKRIKGIPTVLHSEGSLHVIRPDVLIWKITKPAPLTVNVDKDDVKISSGAGKDAKTQSFKLDQLGEGDDASRFHSMQHWLVMDAEKLSQNYDVEKTADGAFTFRPKRPQEVPFSMLTMLLSPRRDLQKLSIEERSGDSTEFVFGRARVKER